MTTYQHDRRVIVYPAYIDAGKTVAEGRRVTKPLACPEPMVHEIHDACRILMLGSEIQDKTYPRDFFTRGRVRVELKREDGSPVQPTIPDRRTLLIKIAEIVRQHPGRGKRAQAAAADKAKALEAASGSGTSGTGGTSGGKGGSTSNKKKNKK